MNVRWLERVEMVERLVCSSSGVAVSTLAHVLGISRDSVERAVKLLVQERRVQWSADLYELKETRGRKGRLVVPAHQSEAAASIAHVAEGGDPAPTPRASSRERSALEPTHGESSGGAHGVVSDAQGEQRVVPVPPIAFSTHEEVG